MRYSIVLMLFCMLVYGVDISPRKVIEASGNVQSIVVFGDKIIAGTNAGTIDVYNISEGTLASKIIFEPIKDFMGDVMPPKVFSVDMLEGTNTYLAVVQAQGGARELYLIENGTQKKLIDVTQNQFITKAKFVDKNKILVALMSNELILFEISTQKELYRTQLNLSHFSDFALNESKTLVASSCESGEITISEVNSGKVIKVLSAGNVDNVYKVDFKNKKILCAGQDRRGIIYDINSGQFDRYDAHFLIYAGALSASGKLGAFAFNEQNDIVIFDLERKSEMYTLKGQKSTLNTIVFVNEKELVSGSDDKFILIWRLP